MKFLVPYKKITLKTTLNEDVFLSKLKSIMNEEKTLFFELFNSDAIKPFKGYIEDDYFKLTRSLNLKPRGIFSFNKLFEYNGWYLSFLPVYTGFIQKDAKGIKIFLNIRLEIPTIIAILSLMIFIIKVIYESNEDSYKLLVLTSLLMIVLYFLIMFIFKFEVLKVLEEFRILFKTEICND